jgi:predicted ATPase
MLLKRIYIDNYKCCVNLELAVDQMNLLLGPNGTGKKKTIVYLTYKDLPERFVLKGCLMMPRPRFRLPVTN